MNGTKHNNTAIDLLILDQSVNDAEACISNLRNAKLAVHSNVVSDQGQLLDSIKELAPDLILFTVEENAFDLDSTLKICLDAFKGVPLILITKSIAQEIILNAIQKGARDAVEHDDVKRLQLIVTREVGDLITRKELAKAQKMLKEAEDRCTGLIESSRDAIAYIHEGMHMYANPVYLEMFGYVEMDDIEGLPILDMISKDSLASFKTFLKELGDEQTELEVACQDSGGKTFEAKLEFSPAAYDDEPCTQIIIRNTQNSKELEQTIEQLSNLDTQTGLPNRSHFMAEIDAKLAAGTDSGTGCSLLYITIDEFQQLRANHGVASGDALIKELAELLGSQISDEEFLARFGDHTFTILSSKANATDAESLAEKLRQQVETQAFESSGSQIHITISVGLAVSEGDTENSQDFINRAYQACDESRANGGDKVTVYDPGEMAPSYGEDDTGDEARINQLIKHALENDRFRMAFQPIVSLQGDSRENYAVLTRLLDQNDEEILPDHFIKYADQGKQMGDIDRWVIKHAIIELADQRQQGRKVNFFVSLSAASLEDDGLLLYICDCLRDTQAKGAWLTFQIRDEDIRTHIQASKKLIAGLKKIKCQIAVDQFGSNKKTESLLKNLPIDFVKFDFELMDDLATKQDKQDYLNELNTQALSHNIKTVAMGVEDANSLAVLWTVGVNYIQGYFLQEPSENIAYEFVGPVT